MLVKKSVLLIVLSAFSVSTVFADDQYSEIKITSVTPSTGILGEEMTVHVEGEGFDEHTKVVLIPDSNDLIQKIENNKFAFSRMLIKGMTIYHHGFHTDYPSYAMDVEVKDNMAYVAGCYPGLKIFDISHPFHPVLIGSLETSLGDVVQGVSLSDNSLYLVDRHCVYIINVNDPKNPFIIDEIPMNDYCCDISVMNHIAYITKFYAGLEIFDFRESSNPISSLDTSRLIGVSATDNTACLTTLYYDDLIILDISDPLAPNIISTYDYPDAYYNSSQYDFSDIDYSYKSGIAVDNNLVYVSQFEHIQIIDISTPSNPYHVTILDMDHYVRDLSVFDNKLYVLGYKYLTILPLAKVSINSYTNTVLELEISSPILAGQYHLEIYNPQYHKSKEVSFTELFDIEKPPDCSITEQSGPIEIPFDVKIKNTNLSIDDYTITVYSLNQSLIENNNISLTLTENQKVIQIKPTNNHQLGTTTIGLELRSKTIYQLETFTVSVCDVFLDDQYQTITDDQYPEINITSLTPSTGVLGEEMTFTIEGEGFDEHTKVVLIPDYDNAAKILESSDYIRDFEIDNNLAYVLYKNDSVEIFDISQPLHPILKGSFQVPGNSYFFRTVRFAVKDSTAYIVLYYDNREDDYPDRIYEIMTIDISDIENPNEKYSYKLRSLDIFNADEEIKVSDIFVTNNILYLANFSNNNCIKVIDLNHPLNVIGSTFLSVDPLTVVVDNNLAYVTCRYSAGLQVIDVSDPLNLSAVSAIAITGLHYNIAVENNIAYLSTTSIKQRDYKIKILDISNPLSPYLIDTFDTQSRNDISVDNHNIISFRMNGLSIISAVQNIEVTYVSGSRLDLKMPSSILPGQYYLKVYNRQYSDTNSISIINPFNIFLPPDLNQSEDIPYKTIFHLTNETCYPIYFTSNLPNVEIRSYTVTGKSGIPSILPDDHITIHGQGNNYTIHVKTPLHRYERIPIHIAVNDGHASVLESFHINIKKPQLNFDYVDEKTDAYPLTHSTTATYTDWIFKVNSEQNCIIKYNMANEEIIRWGQSGSFNHPTGIAIDSDGFIYVADSANNRIQVFSIYGEFITSFGEYGSGALNYPEYIDIDENGNIYISEKDYEAIKQFKKVDYTEGITKAIIVVGGGDTYNSMLEASQSCSDLANTAFRYQGIDQNNILILSPENHNGKATLENIEMAITKWSAGEETLQFGKTCAADSLVIYLVDHGGEGYFIVNENEFLSATVLNSWLDIAQNTINGKLIVVYEACYSGSFIPFISQSKNKNNGKRIVITSSRSNEQAELLYNGAISFSNSFWSSIFIGKDIKTAFEDARELDTSTFHGLNMFKQSPQMDADGNAISDNADLKAVQNVLIGNGINSGDEISGILKISPSKTITAGSSIEITAIGVWAKYGVEKVWAQIIPIVSAKLEYPIELPHVEMDYNFLEFQYKGIYNHFYHEGRYLIKVYVQDSKGITSTPEQSWITVGKPKKQSAIIVIGKPSVNTDISEIKKFAINSLKSKLYFDDDIVVVGKNTDYPLNPDGLEDALDYCVLRSSLDVVLYMIGEGNHTDFFFDDNTTISKTDLNKQMNKIQSNNEMLNITIIYDAPHAKAFLDELNPDNNTDNAKNRILISSTHTDKAFYGFNGKLSFSWHFWNMVSKGFHLNDILIDTNIAFSDLSWDQQLPEIIYGKERSRQYTIGYDIVYLSTTPHINSISPKKTLLCTQSSKIQAYNVHTFDSIDQVIALIYPPKGKFPGINEPEIIQLTHTGNSKDYSAVYDNFILCGEYYISICAFDSLGNMSTPLTTTVIQTAGTDCIISALQVLTEMDMGTIPENIDFNNDGKIGLAEAIYFFQKCEQ